MAETNIHGVLALIQSTIEGVTPTRDPAWLFKQALDMAPDKGRRTRNFTVDVVSSFPVDLGAIRSGTGTYIQNVEFVISIYYTDKNSSIESNASLVEDANSIIQALYNSAYRPFTSDGFRWNGSTIQPTENGGLIQSVTIESRIITVA